MSKKNEIEPWQSCLHCKYRARCWRAERYSDFPEEGQRNYPDDVTCIRFKAQQQQF